MHQQRGNVRYLWIMVGAYLAYLGYQQFQLLIQGESTHPVIGVIAGIVFIAVGGMVLWREWDAWRWSQAHKDDPEEGADALPDASDADDDPSYEDDDPPYADDEGDPSDGDGAEETDGDPVPDRDDPEDAP